MQTFNDRCANPVAQIANLLYRRLAACGLLKLRRAPKFEASADCRSAILETASLRSTARVFTWYLVFGIWSFALVAGTFAQESFAWRPLFNGRDLSGWKVNDFAGTGEVKVEDGKIIIGTGVALTGLKKTEAPLKSNYEVSVDAMKIDGDDFFCGLTFPVKDSHATLIIGGWGGSLVGFSSIDGMDASENEFTQYMRFDKNKWYNIRLRVTDTKIQAWIDGDRMIDADITGRKISMRAGEIEDSVPFGLATYQTTAAIKEIKIRAVPNKIPRIAMIAGKKSHGSGEHEYKKALQLLASELEKRLEFIDVRVHFDGWPTDEETIKDADTIVFYSDGSDRKELDHPLMYSGRLSTIDKLMKRGVGFVAIHYTVFVPKDKAGGKFLDWIGGYFDYETGDTPNKWYSKIETREYKVFPATPEHPICKGVEPFTLKEEFYFKMRFPQDKSKLTPIATFDPEKKDWEKVVGWAIERPDGGRGFGYTGGHYFSNFENPAMQRLLLNAILWTAKAEKSPLKVTSAK
jgi:type 1 glutamine amidotransferase